MTFMSLRVRGVMIRIKVVRYAEFAIRGIFSIMVQHKAECRTTSKSVEKEDISGLHLQESELSMTGLYATRIISFDHKLVMNVAFAKYQIEVG